MTGIKNPEAPLRLIVMEVENGWLVSEEPEMRHGFGRHWISTGIEGIADIIFRIDREGRGKGGA